MYIIPHFLGYVYIYIIISDWWLVNPAGKLIKNGCFMGLNWIYRIYIYISDWWLTYPPEKYDSQLG